ncbi:MAG: METTL5 family protein [Candidatus Hydrothermarchaeales archaeon]
MIQLDKKELEILLEKCDGYRDPKIMLEQYSTPSDIAADLLWLARLKGDIEGKCIYDLGCGTGRLAIGACLMGASRVKGFDVDSDALTIAHNNAAKFSLDIEWVEADIKDIRGECDTVIQNPPFGVHKKEADKVFLKKALDLGGIVYSMHKAETREFIMGYIEKRGIVTDVMRVAFSLPHSYKFHWKPVKRIWVDIYRIEGK